MRRPSTHRGFTLVEMLIVLTIAASVITLGSKLALRWMEKSQAEDLGRMLAQYTAAVSNHLNSATPPAPGAYTGTAWLQDAATCPGATGPSDFLPCGFRTLLPWGLTFTTTVTNVAGNFNATTTLGTAPLTVGGKTRLDLAGHSILAARSVTGASDLGGAMFTLGLIDFDFNGANVIQSVVSTSSTPAEPWLRVDGTNQMLADLNNGGNRFTNSSGLDWANSQLNAAQGGSVELGGTNTTPGVGTPYIDFHQNGLTQDFNARVINDANGRLSVQANTLRSTGQIDAASTAATWSMTTANSGSNAATTPRGSMNVADVWLRSKSAYITQLLPNYVHKGAWLVGNNYTVTKPNCGSGTPKIIVTEGWQANSSQGYMTSRAINYSTYWRIDLRTVADPGMVWNGWGLAQVYCHYI
jgi:prepilin-type N-terminal cleavage/methylation domain-containing protein